MKLDIGGGTIPAAGYVNVDAEHGNASRGLRVRIQDGIPTVRDNTIVAARASHVLEHIPAGADRIKAMNEVHRVLRPGAEFEIIVPVIGSTEGGYAGWQAWADPTHVSYWWYMESFLYFVDPYKGGFSANADYGIRYWELGPHELRDGWEARVTLVKPRSA